MGSLTTILLAAERRRQVVHPAARHAGTGGMPDPVAAWQRLRGAVSRAQMPAPRCWGSRGDAETLLWDAPASSVVMAAYGPLEGDGPQALIDVCLDPMSGLPAAWWQYQREAPPEADWPYQVPNAAWYVSERVSASGWPWTVGAERMLDELAARLGRDPMEYRLALLAADSLEAGALRALAARVERQEGALRGVAVLRRDSLAVAAAALNETLRVEWMAWDAGGTVSRATLDTLLAWTAALARLNATSRERG
jgi:hypothetical protein